MKRIWTKKRGCQNNKDHLKEKVYIPVEVTMMAIKGKKSGFGINGKAIMAKGSSKF